MVLVEKHEFERITPYFQSDVFAIKFTSFSFCKSKLNGSAIYCQRTQNLQEKSFLKVLFCSFYQCSSIQQTTQDPFCEGACVYVSQCKFMLKCSTMNSCQADQCPTFRSLYKSYISLFSSHYCHAGDIIASAIGEETFISTLNESYQITDFQVPGFSAAAKTSQISFITICHCQDNLSCTLSLKCQNSATLSYSNIWNMTSTDSRWGLLLFSNGVDATVSNSVFLDYGDKPLFSFYQPEGTEKVLLVNCTIDKALTYTYGTCETNSIHVTKNATFITPQVKMKCVYNETNCLKVKDLSPKLSFLCILFLCCSE